MGAHREGSGGPQRLGDVRPGGIEQILAASPAIRKSGDQEPFTLPPVVGVS